jgi:putative resolvase
MSQQQLLPKLVKPKKATEILGVNDETLRRWAEAGDLRFVRTPGGHRLYDISSFLSAIDILPASSTEEKESYIYARVSSSKQKKAGDLQRQSESLQSKYPKHTLITDVGSGINFKRAGLRKILQLVLEGKVREVVVEHRDRLCRFGFDLVEFIFHHFGAKIKVENEVDVSPDAELLEDVMSVISVFSAKFNGRRRYKRKQQEDPEGEDVSESGSEEAAEEMVGSQSIPLQQGASKSKRRRKTSF